MRTRRAIVCLLAGLCCPRESASGDAPTPTYTNEDLERLAPYRGQTGVLSKPASRAEAAPKGEPKGHGEDYWRREAERLRRRLAPLRRRAEELRQRLHEARSERKSGGRGARGESAASLARRLEAVEAEIREREDELYERARRERALPGWLR